MAQTFDCTLQNNDQPRVDVQKRGLQANDRESKIFQAAVAEATETEDLFNDENISNPKNMAKHSRV